MNFNRGFYCKECGPIETAKKKTINKVQHAICPECSGIVEEWERPLNERSGRCNSCGNADFELKIWKHQLLRRCKECDGVFNTDTNEVLREGKETK